MFFLWRVYYSSEIFGVCNVFAFFCSSITFSILDIDESADLAVIVAKIRLLPIKIATNTIIDLVTAAFPALDDIAELTPPLAPIPLRELFPDLVLMPSLNDIHQDHATIAHEGLRAFKNTTILGYELIWNNLTFQTTCFFKLDQRHIHKKAKALTAYKSQGSRDYMSEEFIFSLAKARGVQIGNSYAECFEVIRWVM